MFVPMVGRCQGCWAAAAVAAAPRRRRTCRRALTGEAKVGVKKKNRETKAEEEGAVSCGVRLDHGPGCGEPQWESFAPQAANICNKSSPSSSQRSHLHPDQSAPGSAASQHEHHVHLPAPAEMVGCWTREGRAP